MPLFLQIQVLFRLKMMAAMETVDTLVCSLLIESFKGKWRSFQILAQICNLKPDKKACYM